MTLKLTTGALCIPPHANSSVKISHSGPQAEAPRPKTSKIVQTHVPAGWSDFPKLRKLFRRRQRWVTADFAVRRDGGFDTIRK